MKVFARRSLDCGVSLSVRRLSLTRAKDPRT